MIDAATAKSKKKSKEWDEKKLQKEMKSLQKYLQARKIKPMHAMAFCMTFAEGMCIANGMNFDEFMIDRLIKKTLGKLSDSLSGKN